jgi:hypothetical protein
MVIMTRNNLLLKNRFFKSNNKDIKYYEYIYNKVMIIWGYNIKCLYFMYFYKVV